MHNIISDIQNVIVGGIGNRTSGLYSTIVGGYYNKANFLSSTMCWRLCKYSW